MDNEKPGIGRARIPKGRSGVRFWDWGVGGILKQSEREKGDVESRPP